jgi:hypothetical protein
MFYCPRCAAAAVPGQRHCKNCGIKLDVIQDAVEGRRGPLDFDTLKKDLRDLGASLRSGFEEASLKIKQTQKLKQNRLQPHAMNMPDWTKEFNRALRKVRAANTRKYSLQQAALSLFSGGSIIAVWYYLLNAAVESGLLESLELLILDLTGTRVTGLVEFIRLLWLFGLIPMAKGVAHLINAIFFAPRKIEEEAEPVSTTPNYVYSSPVAANVPSASELQDEPVAEPRVSVTEEETVRLERP